MKRLLWAVLCLVLAAPALAADAEWKTVIPADWLKGEKAGYGGLCGVVVDHKTGCVWVNVSDKGIYCSSVGAKEFKRVSDEQPKGRTESPGCLQIDPTGKTKGMVAALVYGSPLAVSPDHGKAWKYLDKKAGHIDWCAVDWTDPDHKFVLALKHEAGGLLMLSTDGGKTFADVGKGYGTGWVFDGQTAVVCEAKGKDRPKPNLMRTTDAGKTWKPVGEYSPVGASSAQALPKFHDGTLYWLTDTGLIASADKGETWKKIGEVKDAQYGPVFGKDAKHQFVLTKAGIVESTDGGATWGTPIAPPKELKGIGGLTWLEYDPVSDSLYLMKMGSELFQLTRGK